MSRKPQKYRLFAQRLPEKAAENSQKTRIREKAGFGVVEPPRWFLTDQFFKNQKARRRPV